MKIEYTPYTAEDLICEKCRGNIWKVKDKCAHPMIKIEHPNPDLDNRCPVH